jgi:hypothetical protein
LDCEKKGEGKMFLRRKAVKKPNEDRSKIDTIVIIGNGFDIWQGLNTSYSQFQQYYLTHRDEILKSLHIEKRVFIDTDGQRIECSDVEIIYGNPFDPSELEDEFWSTFEASLNKLDAERLNLFFGKEKSGLKDMQRCIRNAGRILREAFCNWIATINIEASNAAYKFGDNCVFINFNYTDTLLKKFAVKETKEFHIHGEASDKESIIYGHSSHPQEPEYTLARFGGRFLGLYYVDRVLYETDKHCQDNIQVLCMFLAMHATMCEEIKNVYVLGHSMGPADLEYFDFLIRSTRVAGAGSDSKEYGKRDMDSLDELHNRLQYVIESAGYHNMDVDDEYTEAMIRKLMQEQETRNAMYQREFLKMFGKVSKEEFKKEAAKIEPRTEDAKWHISYYSDRDKLWIETVMRELGCKNFELYNSIDECLLPFKKK